MSYLMFIIYQQKCMKNSFSEQQLGTEALHRGFLSGFCFCESGEGRMC